MPRSIDERDGRVSTQWRKKVRSLWGAAGQNVYGHQARVGENKGKSLGPDRGPVDIVQIGGRTQECTFQTRHFSISACRSRFCWRHIIFADVRRHLDEGRSGGGRDRSKGEEAAGTVEEEAPRVARARASGETDLLCWRGAALGRWTPSAAALLQRDRGKSYDHRGASIGCVGHGQRIACRFQRGATVKDPVQVQRNGLETSSSAGK